MMALTYQYSGITLSVSSHALTTTKPASKRQTIGNKNTVTNNSRFRG
jgi:hypothetical protein